MAFRSYLIQPYKYTHENVFFHSLENKLKIEFNPEQGLHVLIGNINCNGHEIDALFIKKGQISVIDFKDYSGNLSFSENNPWLIENNGRQAFVAGGSAHKNPLQQVKTYKFGLLEYLQERDEELLSENRNDINWGHISGYVLFHGNVNYEEQELPVSIKPWFKISDPNTIIPNLKHHQSQSLQFTDKEIENILRRLDIRPENTYNSENVNLETKSTPTSSSGNFELIQRLIPNYIPSDSTGKIIEYLKTIIQLERQKSPNFESKLFSIEKDDSSGQNIALDIRNNGDFLEVYKQNQSAKFPNDVFVGANFSLGGESYPLLYNVVPLSSISNYNITIDPAYFEINDSVLQDLQLPEEYISNLHNKISAKKTFDGKCNVIERELGKGSITFKETFSLGLSSGTWFTAQLYSELNKLSKENDYPLPSYLEDFLHNRKISHPPEINFDADQLVEITPLNEEQRTALIHSLSKPLSVITGPPGTGKTQLILNLLANIIIQGQTALFASKNNKAVDNVEQRLGEIFSEGFLPRFGSKQYIRDNSKGKILGYLNNLKEEKRTSDSTPKKSVQEYNTNRKELDRSKERLSTISEEVKEVKEAHSQAKYQYDSWLEEIPGVYKKQVLEDRNLPKIDSSNIDQIIHTLNNAQGFFRGLWFKLFEKEKVYEQVKQIDKQLPTWMYERLQQEAPLIKAQETFVQTGLKHLDHIKQLKKNIYHYLEKDGEWNNKLNSLKTKYENLKEEYENLKKQVPELRKKVQDGYDNFLTQSKNYVASKRHEKLSNIQEYELNLYLNYIPDNIPWKYEEVDQFAQEAKDFTEFFNIVSVTSLSIKSSYPLKQDLFDYIIIDEASQCDIASVVPLLQRAKKIIIIGDDQQLTHITRVNKEEDNYISELMEIDNGKSLRYSNQSLYDYGAIWATNNQLDSIFLPKHYRCHPDIIRFSNTFFYKRKKGKELDIQTDNSSYPVKEQGIFWHDVAGKLEDRQNINKTEAFKAIELAKKLAEENPNASIGIITPFRHQYKFIQNNLDESTLKRINPITVHQAQGDEEDIIILSLIVGYEAKTSLTTFINDIAPYLLNVAVTRARGALHIVGNHQYCINLRGNSPLSQLAQYCVGQEALLS